jgi:SAM-dependent methyltransferase
MKNKVWKYTKFYRWLRKRFRLVRFGSLRRTAPISQVFGLDRGVPIDRYYIEQFLLAHSAGISGRVLEIGDDAYTRKFGGSRVTKSDILHVAEGNAQATIVADLASADQIASNTFDCIVITQTLQFIYNVPAAVRNLHRILKPGGVVLATFPGISQISRYDMDRWGDYWRFTSLSAKRLFGEVFLPENVEVKTCGNVLTAVAFLHGLTAQELKRKELDFHDPDYEVTITVSAKKPC